MEGSVGSEMEEYLVVVKEYVEVLESGKIKCLVTGHEMPAKKEVLQKHFEGKKFKAKKAKWVRDYDFTQHEPYIVPDRTNPKHFLYCKVTKRPLNRAAKEVEAHVNGRRYKAALELAQHEEISRLGKDGMELEDEEMELMLMGGKPQPEDELDEEYLKDFGYTAGEENENQIELEEDEQALQRQMDEKMEKNDRKKKKVKF